MSADVQKVLAVAQKYVDAGYQEGTNNDTIFGKEYGLNHQPWCAMFVSACFREAGFVKLVAAQSPKGYASCDAGYAWFKKNNQLVPVEEAQAGDVIFFNFDETPSDSEHTGLCKGNAKDKKKLYVYEGNTSGDAKGSQRNGDGVYLKTRDYKLVMGVGRPKWPAAK
jgi:hypothetical protein